VPPPPARCNSYIEGEFRKDHIYTRTGSVLLAVNPFKWMIPHYADPVVRKYHAGVSDADAVPHLFQEAEAALRSIHASGEPAHFVLAGRSGSGKKETAKFLFHYLAATSGMDQRVTGATREGGPQGGRSLPCLLEPQLEGLCDALGMLESFGNAKTSENENSSRFGSFAKVFFNGNMIVDGAHFETLMLETSRCIGPPRPEERNFHAFYQVRRVLLCGL